jgi:hypothetical protein
VKVQPTLWDAPPPPSGPQKDVSRFIGGTYERYVRWRTETPEGRRAFSYITGAALVAAERGDTRVSINRLVEQARAALHVEIDNTARAWISDDIIARHPHLTDVIERRKRRKAA